MKELSELAQRLYSIIIEESFGAYGNSLSYSFKPDRLIDYLLDSRSFRSKKQDEYAYLSKFLSNEVNNAIHELINSGILLQTVSGDIIIPDPVGIIRQRKNRGSH